MPDQQITISIIMAAYNAERFIAESIRSVLAQTYTNWELLLVNDGSTDQTENIIASFQDARIRYFTQANAGVSAARNKGLAAMRGVYFCFLDADDILPPESLTVRVGYLEAHPDVDMLDGVVEVRDEKLETVLRIYRPSFTGNPAGEYVRLNEQVFFGPNLFLRRKERHYYFKEGMTHAEDLWFYTELAWTGNLRYDHVDDLVYLYRKSGNSAMANLKALEKGYRQFYELVKVLPGINHLQTNYLKRRITRIMCLSYLRRLQIKDSLKIISWYFFRNER
jgi:glycosyltransferase involved in cell wall biosynthesis